MYVYIKHRAVIARCFKGEAYGVPLAPRGGTTKK